MLLSIPLPGSRPSLVPGMPRRKALQPDKAGWPHSMSTWALLPSLGPAVHPLSHGEKLPSALLASLHFCLQGLWSHQPCTGGWDGGHFFTVTWPHAQLSASCPTRMRSAGPLPFLKLVSDSGARPEVTRDKATQAWGGCTGRTREGLRSWETEAQAELPAGVGLGGAALFSSLHPPITPSPPAVMASSP